MRTNLIDAFVQLGEEMITLPFEWHNVLSKAHIHNNWFTVDNTQHMLKAIADDYLQKEGLKLWLEQYPENPLQLKVALIMAGNIPLAGFHDFLCVLLSGNIAQIKLSAQDTVILPYIAQRLIHYCPPIAERINFVEKIVAPDAVIATGSNNSTRYFDYYFSKYPHIIRHNRNSVAVLTGSETDTELESLADDIFLYFGLGCRSISKIFMPIGFPVDKIFNASAKYHHYIDHNKYKNNYDYHCAIYLLKQIPFLTNDLLILRESDELAAPVSVLNYEYYNSIDEVHNYLLAHESAVQCIATSIKWPDINTIPLGQTQYPGLSDYADNIDTMAFLTTSSIGGKK